MDDNGKADKLARLRAPFPASDIEWRVGSGGVTGDGKPWAKVLAFITARAVMDRLDEVFGPDNWQNSYIPTTVGASNGFLCTISARIHPDGEWIHKVDGAEGTDIETLKGGISDALKRTAVCWGVGRYLYDLGESWAEDLEVGPAKVRGSKRYYTKIKDQWCSWNPPSLPKWALPAGDTSQPTAGTIPPPPVEPPKPETKTSNKAKVNAAKAKIALTPTIDELGVISKYADSLLEKGDITEADRKEIDKAVKDATKRIKEVATNPSNPDNKE